MFVHLDDLRRVNYLDTRVLVAELLELPLHRGLVAGQKKLLDLRILS